MIITVLLLSACQQMTGMEAEVPSPVDNNEDIDTVFQYGEAEYFESVRAIYSPILPEEKFVLDTSGFGSGNYSMDVYGKSTVLR